MFPTLSSYLAFVHKGSVAKRHVILLIYMIPDY